MTTSPAALPDSAPQPQKEWKEQDVPLNAIWLPAKEIRRDLDSAKLHELAQSMKQIGQLHRIGLRPLDGQRYELLYGERRLRAAAILGWPDIQARVFSRVQRPEMALAITASENLHTQNLKTIETLSILHEYRSRSLDARAMSQILSKPETWVGDHLFVMQDAVARAVAETGALADAHSLKNFMALPPAIRTLLLETA